MIIVTKENNNKNIDKNNNKIIMKIKYTLGPSNNTGSTSLSQQPGYSHPFSVQVILVRRAQDSSL